MPRHATYPRCRVVLTILLEDFADGSGEVIPPAFPVIPRSVEIERNGYRQADTFSLELDHRDFPIDPRMIRSVLVGIYLGDVGDPTTEISLDDESFRAFLGYVDEPETSLEESGEVVRFRGRDYTSLFLDRPWTGGAIDVDRRLGDVLLEIVMSVPGTDGFKSLEASPDADMDLVLADIIGRKVYAPQANDDVWTILVDLCGRVGFIPVIELDRLLVLTPDNFSTKPLWEADGLSRAFGGRKASFLYGENVAKLSYKRDFKDPRSIQVEIRCWDEVNRALLTARYPATPVVIRKKVSTTGKASTDSAPIVPLFVQGCYTQAHLEYMAYAAWEEMARSQVEGELETKEMVDLSGQVDLPTLANGDTLTVVLGSTLQTSIAGMSSSEAIVHLTSPPRAFDIAIATALVTSWKQAQELAAEFYVASARHRWTRDEGYTLTVAFINYIGVV